LVYVAEFSPEKHRGFYTSFNEMNAFCGLILSLIVVFLVRLCVGDAAFMNYGWRIPFLISIILLGITLYIRVSLSESPVFQSYRDAGIFILI
jgi:MFS family permease